jgi:Zn-dependent protease with chaperone function
MAIRVDCPHCGETLHVKDEFAGRKGKCPKCQQPFQVPQRVAVPVAAHQGDAGAPAAGGARPTSVPSSSAGRPEGKAAASTAVAPQFVKAPVSRTEVREQILAAFRDKLAPPRVSLLRKLGTFFVLFVLLVMPLFYLAAVGGLIYLMYWLAITSYGRELPPPVFWIAEVVSGLLLICLLKPLVEPRRRLVGIYPLTPAKEDLLIGFVARICDQIDAPPPAAIQTECSVRLSAEHRRGMLGIARRDVVLTLGLPLVACLSVEQLAGLIANQMGQYRRRAGSRATNFIRAINGWLWRSVYDNGRFDAWLARVAERRHFHLAKLLLPLRAAKFVAQAVLFVPMFIGNTVASSLVRLVELDADRCTARLVGRETFASLLVHVGVVEFTWQGVLAELNFLHRDQQLPDSLPQQLAVRMLDMTPELCAALRDTVVKQEERPFDARATDEERLAATQNEPGRGVLDCHFPASALLTDYEGLARQVTWDYYVSLFGPRLLKEAMTPVVIPAGAG